MTNRKHPRPNEQKTIEENQLPLFSDYPLDEKTDLIVSSTGMNSSSDREFSVSLLALGSIRGLGLKSLKAITHKLDGNLPHVWQLSQDELEIILSEAKTPSSKKVATEITRNVGDLLNEGERLAESMTASGVSILSYHSLPARLRNIPDDPVYWLFVEGCPDILTTESPMVAVVGTRTPSEMGKRATERIVQLMVRYPTLTIVSGLAEGIDEVAHSVSLKHNVTNVAFLGHGINHVFPEKTRSVRELIVRQGGAVATEYLPNDKFQKAFFVRRNRLQAALADLIIPVEAAEKSGTAHTLNFAYDYRKDIVGVRWAEATGIINSIVNRGLTAVDIFEDRGLRELDSLFRALADRHQANTFAFEQTKRTFYRELSTRHSTANDFEELLRMIQESFDIQFPDHNKP